MRSLCLAALALCCSAASAQTLEEYYAQVRQADPRLGIANQEIEVARAQQRQALGDLLPRASLQAGQNRTRREYLEGPLQEPTYFDGSRLSVAVEQPVFNMPRIKGYQGAGAMVSQSEFDAARQAAEVRFDVIDRYLTAAAAAQKAALARQEEVAVAGQLGQARALYARQLAKVTDVLSTEAEYDLRRALRVRAEAELRIATDALSELSNQPLVALWTLNERPKLPESGGDIEEWASLGMGQNPQIRAHEQAVRQAALEVDKRQWMRAPVLSLQASGLDTDIGYDNSFAPRAQTGVVGLNLVWPLYYGGALSAGVHEAQARSRIAELELEATRRTVRTEARAAYLSLQSLTEQVIATRRAADSSSRSVEASERGYSLGVTTIADLLNARRDLYVAQRGALSAQYDYLRQWAALQLVSGQLEDAAVARVSAMLNSAAPDFVLP